MFGMKMSEMNVMKICVGIFIKVDAIVSTKRSIRDKAGKIFSFIDFMCVLFLVLVLVLSGIG